MNILATITPVLIILFFPFRKEVNKPRKIDSISHYIFTLLSVPIMYWYSWGDNWKLFSDDNVSLFREMVTFNAIICPLHGLFINEVWYLIDMLEKLYLTITRKSK